MQHIRNSNSNSIKEKGKNKDILICPMMPQQLPLFLCKQWIVLFVADMFKWPFMQPFLKDGANDDSQLLENPKIA